MTHAGLLAAIFAVAALYASVGHGGASGYLAALSLFGFMPAQMKASALVLNLLVAAIAFLQYRRAGHFHPELFWPFAAGSIPLAFVGGWIQLSTRLYCALLAAALVVAAVRLALRDASQAPAEASASPPPLGAALAVGGGIGLLSGLVGVGGGIFLSPLMILLGWADPKATAAVCAAFIWVNSLSGLAGQLGSGVARPLALWPLALAAMAGGYAGACVGARRLNALTLRRLLSAVLLIAAFKLLRVAWPPA